MSNVARQIEGHLDSEQLQVLRLASKTAADQGAEIYLVGGTVRDILLGSRPVDLDLVVVGSTPDFPEVLAKQLGGEVVAQSQFGTNKLKVDGADVDLAAARKESYAHSGALPRVVPGSINDDLERRDFSINAMAVSLAEETWGELLDPFGGQADVQQGVVRVLHPRSFVDDPTRILRAVRYAYRLGFRIEEETERLLKRDLRTLDQVSGDRIRNELERFFHEGNVAEILEGAQELGVLSAIHPALRIEAALLRKLDGLATNGTTENTMRLLAVLAFSIPAIDTTSLVGRLNMNGRWARIVRDVAAVRDSFEELKGENVRPSQVHRLLRDYDTASIEGCALATDDPLVEQRLELYLKELRQVKPLLDGNDLIALGVPEGPEVGRLLDAILTARLDGLLSTREEEENLVRRSLG